jgi:hypothetical protein
MTCFDAHDVHMAMGANASLISAAPDMLAALEQCLMDCESKEVVSPRHRITLSAATQQMARAAIAKAKGGSL